jgi:hypothetical protein
VHWAERAATTHHLGFEPGVAIEQATKIVTSGSAAGIDYSDTMVKQAAKRNAEAVKGGRVVLIRTSAAEPRRLIILRQDPYH